MTLTDALTSPVLIYGIGNVGRQDDGVGPLLIDALAASGVPDDVTLESGYQLVPEDALLLSTHRSVLLVDAIHAEGARAPYALARVAPASEISFTSHSLTPGALLTLCQRLYGHAPSVFTLAIPAYAFDVNAPPSPAAADHLACALSDLRAALVNRTAR